VNVVAVLGGGGAKAVAHVGAWRALVEAGLTPSCVIGTSMGAVMGAAFASGQTYDRVLGHIRAMSGQAVAPLNPLSIVTGIFSEGVLLASPLERVIERFVPATTFADLEIPLVVTAVDLATSRLVLFGDVGTSGGRDGKPAITNVPLRLGLQAACALPVYYEPVTVYGRRYADGGLRAVLPLEPARELWGQDADLFVAVDVGPGFDEIPSPSASGMIPPLVRAHGEATRILMAELTERSVAGWPQEGPKLVVVRAVAESEATFAAGEAERYVEMGYEATRSALRSRRVAS
jgi:NTE family protein